MADSSRLMALLAARGLSGFRRRFLTHLLPASTNVPFFRKYALLFGWKPLAHPVPIPVAPPGRSLAIPPPGIGAPGGTPASWGMLTGKNPGVRITGGVKGVNVGAGVIAAPTLGLVGKSDREMVPIGPGIAPAAVLSTFPMKPNSPGSPISSDLDMNAPPDATPALALLALSAPLIAVLHSLLDSIYRSGKLGESDASSPEYTAV